MSYLDDEELEATRIMNGSKKINVEEDIKILEKFKNNEIQRDKLERDNRCGGWKIGDIYKYLELNTAIEHILSEREADKKRIKELEEEKKTILNSKIGIDLSYDDYIPKQKIEDKIEELTEQKKALIYTITLERIQRINAKIKVLEELLEDK